MNKILFLALFVTFTGTSCISQRKCLQRFPPSVTSDSIYIETVKEIPVYLPGDSVKVEVPVDCPDQIIANIETAKLTQQIEILKGKLISVTHIKPDTIKVKVIETRTEIKEVEISMPVKFVPKIIKILAWIGAGCILLFIGWIVLKFVK